MKKFRRARKALFHTGLVGACLVIAGTIALVIDGLSDELGNADVGLVLGSKVETTGVPSSRLKSRLDRAVELFREGYFPMVIVSGGFGKEGYDEAVVMRDYLIQEGVPVGKILLDSQGTTTFASAQNTSEIARAHGFRSVFVVSQYFHLSRSKLALRKLGFTSVRSAHARIFEWRDLYSIGREVAGYPVYFFRSSDR